MLKVVLISTIALLAILLIYQTYKPLPSEYLASKQSSSQLGVFKHYAVSTDSALCAKVGSELLAKGGHAVDAAIGVLLCMGVVVPNCVGLGGGGSILVYNINKGSHNGSELPYAISIDGRERAPFNSSGMFDKNNNLAHWSTSSVGVPGALSAYATAYKMFGRLEWSKLFEKAISFAKKGVPVIEQIKHAIDMEHFKGPWLNKLHNMQKNDVTSNNYAENEDDDIIDETPTASNNIKRHKFEDQKILIKNLALADTLNDIAFGGPDVFYDGNVGKSFINDLEELGGKLSVKDLSTYKSRVSRASKFQIDEDLDLFTTPLPGSGIVLSIILRVMQRLGYNSPKLYRPFSLVEAALYYHHFIEACKFAYGQQANLEDYPPLDEDNYQMLSYLEEWEAQQPKSWAEQVVKRQPCASFANGTRIFDKIIATTFSEQRKIPSRLISDEEKKTNSETRKRLDALIARLSSSEFIDSIVANISHRTREPDFYGSGKFFVPNSRTAHVSVVDADGNAVSATTSINLNFGTNLVSKSTGLIYNNAMDDFVRSGPTYKFNYNHIQPGRRPLSSTSPSVFVDSKTGNVKLVVGASGDSKVMSAIGLVSTRHVFSHTNIEQSIDAPRIYHQLHPNKIYYEKDFPLDLLNILQSTHGHQVEQDTSRSASAVMAIVAKNSRNIHDLMYTLSTSRVLIAKSDYRKSGAVSGH